MLVMLVRRPHWKMASWRKRWQLVVVVADDTGSGEAKAKEKFSAYSDQSYTDPYFHKLLRQAQVHSSHQPSLLAPQVSQVSASPRSQPSQLIRLDLYLEGRWVQLHRVSGQYCRQQRRSNERTVCGYSESMNKLLNPKARKTDSEAVSSTRL